MAKILGTSVLCSQCGKKLRGVVGVLRGFHVGRHKTPAVIRVRATFSRITDR